LHESDRSGFEEELGVDSAFRFRVFIGVRFEGTSGGGFLKGSTKVGIGLILVVLFAATVMISSFPIIWIGGAIMGIWLILAGLKQWSDETKIAKMSEVDYRNQTCCVCGAKALHFNKGQWFCLNHVPLSEP
jgi:hypothetical protein